MKLEFAAAVVATLALAPAMATAQQFSGQIGLDFTSIDDGAEQSTDLNGAVETALGPVGVQLDFSSLQNSDGNDISSVGLHVFYNISPSTAVGLVYYREDWVGDGIYVTYGIEAAHVNGPWEFQGFAVREESAEGGSYEADLSGVSARYQVRPNITVGGGFVSI